MKDYYFDVSIKTKTDKNGVKSVSKTTIGNEIFFTNTDLTDTSTTQTLGSGVDVVGRKSIAEVSVAYTSYSLDQNTINSIAADVATWLCNNDYTSTADVLAKGTDVAEMLQFYANTGSTGANGGYAV